MRGFLHREATGLIVRRRPTKIVAEGPLLRGYLFYYTRGATYSTTRQTFLGSNNPVCYEDKTYGTQFQVPYFRERVPDSTT